MQKVLLNYNLDVIPKLEKRFKVRYPETDNATYISLVNYGSDLKLPIQRWYRYKEGYSLRLVEQLFAKYSVGKNDLIIDPFCGSGSTLVQAKISGVPSVGFEINPFSSFLAKVKTQNYDLQDSNQFVKEKKYLAKVDNRKNNNKPVLSTIDKLFSESVLNYLLNLRDAINRIKNVKVRDLYFLSYLSILEEASNYRKNGNGLKIRKGVNLERRDLHKVKDLFNERIAEIEEDLDFASSISNIKIEPKIIEHTALEMDKYIKPGSVKGVIFSPPYANCFDYTEIYKVELWMGEFVKQYSDLKELRHRSVRSHLNGYVVEDFSEAHSLNELNELVSILKSLNLWDKRIPEMIKAYFSDMFTVLDHIYNSLEKGGFCSIIVSNSAYGGTVVPTDLLLSRYAEKIGFDVSEINVARYIITSSQQYKQTEQHRKYLRESIIHLQK